MGAGGKLRQERSPPTSPYCQAWGASRQACPCLPPWRQFTLLGGQAVGRRKVRSRRGSPGARWLSQRKACGPAEETKVPGSHGEEGGGLLPLHLGNFTHGLKGCPSFSTLTLGLPQILAQPVQPCALAS